MSSPGQGALWKPRPRFLSGTSLQRCHRSWPDVPTFSVATGIGLGRGCFGREGVQSCTGSFPDRPRLGIQVVLSALSEKIGSPVQVLLFLLAHLDRADYVVCRDLLEGLAAGNDLQGHTSLELGTLGSASLLTDGCATEWGGAPPQRLWNTLVQKSPAPSLHFTFGSQLLHVNLEPFPKALLLVGGHWVSPLSAADGRGRSP
jgi:hypothetical protein